MKPINKTKDELFKKGDRVKFTGEPKDLVGNLTWKELEALQGELEVKEASEVLTNDGSDVQWVYVTNPLLPVVFMSNYLKKVADAPVGVGPSTLVTHSHVVSPEDVSTCLGSGELKPCPFCGHDPISSGMVNLKTLNYVHKVLCPSCEAGVHSCMMDSEDNRVKARKKAVKKWNRRTP